MTVIPNMLLYLGYCLHVFGTSKGTCLSIAGQNYIAEYMPIQQFRLELPFGF